ncbi:hypothetical protein JMJ77_0004008 [Colletotrichum scovillei]|uniref:Uncharacterized protein n=1 Tax=Colletotrichum scovillei TaxID=1209932 RepID=A0A9P7U6Y2_9PEZI|nr:hypothetical protein JMJ77_0004008 [Colletotrichum scovillei]KAG7049257.1 hypothetical protein JMJ78_0013240 [Colletotrichum scovillei]KAG7063999.1 hypothetical protein JMJ76_0007047 [Colletotrichum scovillei]
MDDESAIKSRSVASVSRLLTDPLLEHESRQSRRSGRSSRGEKGSGYGVENLYVKTSRTRTGLIDMSYVYMPERTRPSHKETDSHVTSVTWRKRSRGTHTRF